MPWNAKSDARKLGPDLVYRPMDGGLVGQSHQSHDRVVRSGVPEQQFTDFVTEHLPRPADPRPPRLLRVLHGRLDPRLSPQPHRTLTIDRRKGGGAGDSVRDLVTVGASGRARSARPPSRFSPALRSECLALDALPLVDPISHTSVPRVRRVGVPNPRIAASGREVVCQSR
jgi:hypothetical protein